MDDPNVAQTHNPWCRTFTRGAGPSPRRRTFPANLVLNTRGDRQSVTIESPGHEVTQVSATFTRTS
jgi:hypothetical protein